MTQLSDYQAKIKDIDATWRSMNSCRFGNVCPCRPWEKCRNPSRIQVIYERYSAGLRKEVDIANSGSKSSFPKRRFPKELKPEFAELKEDVIHLGGTKKIRELLAAKSIRTVRPSCRTGG